MQLPLYYAYIVLVTYVMTQFYVSINIFEDSQSLDGVIVIDRESKMTKSLQQLKHFSFICSDHGTGVQIVLFD